MPLRVLLFWLWAILGSKNVFLYFVEHVNLTFLFIYTLASLGIFVNLDSCFVKSLGMLTSTALWHALIPFSLFSLPPGPPGTSYRFSLSGPLGWQSGIATMLWGRTSSFLVGNCLYFKTNKQTNKPRRRIWESLLTQYFCLSPPENSFQPFAQIHCWSDDHCSLIQSPALASHLWKNLFAYCSLLFLSNLLRVNVT